MRKILVAIVALALVGVSTQALVNPLQQDRFFTMEGSIKESYDEFQSPQLKNFGMPKGVTDVPMCVPGSPDYFKFLGLTIATLTQAAPVAEAETPCFKRTKFSVQWIDSLTAKITFENFYKKSAFCADHFLTTTLISFDVNTNWQFTKSSVTYKFKTSDEAEYARLAGIKIVLMCDRWLNLIPDFIKTAALFMREITGALKVKLPKKIQDFFMKVSYDFLQRYVEAKLQPRKPKVAITEEYIRQYIKSGDILTASGPAGTSSLIYYGTGGPVTHAAIAMWDDKVANKLWILEANEQGLVRMELEDWYSAYNYQVAWLPLSEENRRKFDPVKAWNWFRSVENLEYGIHNFFFTVLDDPLHNFDYISDIDSTILLMRTIDFLSGNNGLLDTAIGLALNNRLGTKGLKFSDLLYEIQRRGKNLNDILRIPEKDGWIYNGQQDYVCSALAIKMLEEGGLFAGLTINSHEFTPRDVFMVQLYNSDPSKLPANCQINDPGTPFCQLKGQYIIGTRLYNTIKPYSNMNDNCPSMAPDFYRPPTC